MNREPLIKRKCCPKIPYRKVTHVIFDLDGTILDTESLIEEVLTEICAKCEKTFSASLHNKTAGAIVEDIAKLLINEVGVPFSQEEIVEMYIELTMTKCSNIDFMPGAEQMIRHFAKHNVPIAVATSSAQDLMLLKTERHRKVFDLFHHIVCGGSDPEVKAGKPAPDIFLVCASRFPENPDPADCLVFEDAPNGIKGALTAGMQVVMLPQDDVPYEIWKKATLRLDSFEYMAPELFGLPPMVVQGPTVPKISFTMHYKPDGEEGGQGNAGAQEKGTDQDTETEQKVEQINEADGTEEELSWPMRMSVSADDIHT